MSPLNIKLLDIRIDASTTLTYRIVPFVLKHNKFLMIMIWTGKTGYTEKNFEIENAIIPFMHELKKSRIAIS